MADRTVSLDDLAEIHNDVDDIQGLVSLARCVNTNLESTKELAGLHVLLGLSWAQTKGLCDAVERILHK